MQCKFEVGQQVVCITDKWRYTVAPEKGYPALRAICTIDEIIPHENSQSLGNSHPPSGVWLKLVGYGNGIFCSGEFRPARMNRNLMSLDMALRFPNLPLEVRQPASVI